MSRLLVRSWSLAGIALFSLLVLSSCGDGPSEPSPTPTIAVSIDPVAATVEQGGSTDVQVTVTGQEGFTGTATITVEGVPAGVTGTVGNVQTSGSTTTGTVTILVGAAVAPGTYNITVRASGSGVSAVTVTFTLTVTETPAYELSATPTELTVDQGAQATTDITLARVNFTGDVTLSVEGAPAGMTTSFDVNPVAGDAAVLTVAPDATVAVDTYTLTIRGISATLADRTLDIQVAVTEAPAYELSADPDQLIIEQDAQGTTDITLARTNFTGEVTLSVEGAPAGMTTSFDVNPVAGDAAVLTLAPDATVPMDTYTLAIRGTSAGLADRILSISVSVTESTAPDFMLDVTPSELAVQQGESDQVQVTLTRSNFAGPVTLSAENVPAEVSVTFPENPVNDAAADVTITVGAAAVPGSYGITVRGTADGLADRTGMVTLTVLVPPAYDLSLDPTSISIDQGESGTVDVALDRTNFTGDVTLSLEGAPAGVTGQFSVNPVAGDASLLALDVGAAVAEGSYTLTVRGTATGLADRTETLTLGVEEPPAYALSLDPAAPGIVQGESGTVDVTIGRTNFAGDVTLSLEGTPAGVTGQFSPNPASGDASVLTLEVGLAVPVGSYPLTVRGETASLADRTAALTLTVEEVSGFSLDAIAPVSIQQGASGSRPVGITRTGGFAGDVTVTVTDLPVGITATVDPATTSGTQVEITLDVAGNVGVGSYTATVRGNAPGQPESTQPLEIGVTTSGGQSVTLDFSACTTSETPAWFAYQDGAGPWTPVSGLGDAYTFNVTSTEVGIAFATLPGGGESNVVVFYGTASELVGVEVEEFCELAPSGKTVTATIQGTSMGNQGTLTLGGSTVQTSDPGPVAVTFQDVPDGPVDLVGYLFSLTVQDRMYLLRGQNPADGGDLGTIDLNGIGSFQTMDATITVQGGSGSGFWSTEYATSPAAGICDYAPLQSQQFLFGGQFTARGVPSGRQSAGDYHVFTVIDGTRTVSQMFQTLEARTLVLGQALPTPTVTDISGTAGYRRVRYQTTLPAEYNGVVSIGLSDTSADRTLVVFASAGWLGGTSISLEVPDFTGAGGWNDTWAPTTAATSDWFFTATGRTGDDCTEGAREVTAVETGTIG